MIYVLPMRSEIIPLIIRKKEEKEIRMTWCYKKYIWESKRIEEGIKIKELNENEKIWEEYEKGMNGKGY